MKVTDIKSNGVSYHEPATSSIPTIETAIALYKMRFSLDEILDKFDQSQNFYPGSRFNDNHKVVIRIASALTRAAEDNLENATEDILEGYIKAFVESLSGNEMDQIIINGLEDCAQADHWYQFEKEWD